jgi:hypothetical protein
MEDALPATGRRAQTAPPYVRTTLLLTPEILDKLERLPVAMATCALPPKPAIRHAKVT